MSVRARPQQSLLKCSFQEVVIVHHACAQCDRRELALFWSASPEVAGSSPRDNQKQAIAAMPTAPSCLYEIEQSLPDDIVRILLTDSIVPSNKSPRVSDNGF